MNNAIPEEVELMANELVRVCARYHVALTAFAFAAGSDDGSKKPFVFHFGTIGDRGNNLRRTHDMLLDFIERSGVEQKILYKNDA